MTCYHLPRVSSVLLKSQMHAICSTLLFLLSSVSLLYQVLILLFSWQIKREISTMKFIRHPNVIRMFEVSIWLFMNNIPIVLNLHCNLWIIWKCTNYWVSEYLSLQVMASKTKIYIVMEFVTGGELFDKIVCSMFDSWLWKWTMRTICLDAAWKL